MRTSPGLFVAALFGLLLSLACPDSLEACWRSRRQHCETSCCIPSWVTVFCPPTKAGEAAKVFNGGTPPPAYCWCCSNTGNWVACGTGGSSCSGSSNIAYTFTCNYPNDDATCEYSSAITDSLFLKGDACVYAMICGCTGCNRFATPCEVLNDYNHPAGPHLVTFLPLNHLGMRCKCHH
jgi:hypothetical protein